MCFVNILDLFFPRICFGCGHIGKYFCRKCSLQIRYFSPQICPVCTRPAFDGVTHDFCRSRYTLDGLTSIFRYEGIIKIGVKKIKYKWAYDICREIISLLPPNLELPINRYSDTNHILIPVPLHPKRLRWRGFNQAEILGKIIAENTGWQIKKDIIIRGKETKNQADLKRNERLKNMIGAFSINPKYKSADLRETNFIVFDDVWTTGATLRNCSNVLKRFGAGKVWGLTLAHG